jgi:hypothetical protein
MKGIVDASCSKNLMARAMPAKRMRSLPSFFTGSPLDFIKGLAIIINAATWAMAETGYDHVGKEREFEPRQLIKNM